MSAIPYPQTPSARTLALQVLSSLFIGLILFTLTAGLAVAGFQMWYVGRIYPGVSIAGVEVGGLTPQAAALRLEEQITFPMQGKIVLQEGGRIWTVTPAEMGLRLDANASVDRAFQVGRQGPLAERLRQQFRAWTGSTNLSPTLVFEERYAYNFVAGLAEEINTPVIEAGLGVEGTEVIVHSGQRGRTVNIAATLEALSQQVQSLTDGVVPIVVDETEPVILDASAQAEKARQILSEPLVITMPDGDTSAGPWEFDRATLASMLTIERVESNGSGRYQIGLNSEMLLTFLTNLAPGLQRYPQNARFIFNDDTGQLDVMEPSISGRTLNVEATLHAIRDGLERGEHTIPLVFNFEKPRVTEDMTGAELGITELVYAQSTYFYGSDADRVQNIKTAAASFHGLLVAPGETFSMASALGDISLDNGYAEALIIVGDQTIKGVGGGVCQVSTTLFRTAFFAGYPIVERHQHAYRVSYYERVAGGGRDASLAGLDAAVFVPLVDFKFVNDTPYWLLMETYVNPAASTITWKFYSTKDGREVEWRTTGPTNIVEPPEPRYKENPDLAEGEIKQVDWAAQGADVTVDRWVYRNGELYFKDTFFTRYQAWQAVYEYGPGTEIPTPEPTPGE